MPVIYLSFLLGKSATVNTDTYSDFVIGPHYNTKLLWGLGNKKWTLVYTREVRSLTRSWEIAPQAALSADFISNVQKQTSCSFQASGKFWASKSTKLSYMIETSEHKDQMQTVLQDSRLLDKMRLSALKFFIAFTNIF